MVVKACIQACHPPVQSRADYSCGLRGYQTLWCSLLAKVAFANGSCTGARHQCAVAAATFDRTLAIAANLRGSLVGESEAIKYKPANVHPRLTRIVLSCFL